MWLPGVLGHRRVPSKRMRQIVEKMRPVGRRLDSWFQGRLPKLASAPVKRLAALAVLCLCLTIPPLEIIPFATTAPTSGIALFGLAFMVRDGLLMCLGFTAASCAVLFGLWIWSGIPLV
jgi:hypothetical protein